MGAEDLILWLWGHSNDKNTELGALFYKPN